MLSSRGSLKEGKNMAAYAVIAFVLGIILIPIVAVGTGFSALGIALTIIAILCVGSSGVFFSSHGM